jgi:uncharacterized protein YndB with AHSA1/START domain
MNGPNPTRVVKDLKEKSILVTRDFNAPVEHVWRAYSESGLLDQWWGPAPWRAETRHFDFVAGGYWLYAMVGPDGERHWGRMNYLAIDHHRSITIEDVFCDEHGAVNADLPASRGQIVFSATSTGTRVDFKMHYASDEDIRKLVEMGFEQGITACLEQLAQLLPKLTG